MKLLVYLSLVLVISTAQGQEFSIFDMVEESMKNGTDYLKGIVYEFVIEEDGSAYKILAQSVLDMVEPQFCPTDSVEQCAASTSWLLGCNCREEFAALGECSTVPCRAFSWIKTKGPEALSKFFIADSYEKKAKVLVDYLVKPMGNLLCECPEVIGASVKCGRKYDGKIFEMMPTDFDMSVMQSMDWKTIQRIIEPLLKVSCEEHKGENCKDQLGDLYIKIGAFLDNTFSGQDICNSGIRVEAEYTAYLLAMGQREDDISTYLQGLVDSWVNLEYEITCNAECADEMQQIYYNSCCMKRFLDLFLEKDMKKSLLKFVKSYAKLIVEGPLPNLKKHLNKYLTIYDLEKFCGDEIDAFREFNEQCNAIEA